MSVNEVHSVRKLGLNEMPHVSSRNFYINCNCGNTFVHKCSNCFCIHVGVLCTFVPSSSFNALSADIGDPPALKYCVHRKFTLHVLFQLLVVSCLYHYMCY